MSVYKVRGVGGELEVFEDKVVITPKGVMGGIGGTLSIPFVSITGIVGMSRVLLKLSGSLVHDYATISDDSPSPNRASRARRAATSAGIS